MDNSKYVYAHGQSCTETARIMAPYVGKEMIIVVLADSKFTERRIELVSVDGVNVTYWYNGDRCVEHICNVFGNFATEVIESKNVCQTCGGDVRVGFEDFCSGECWDKYWNSGDFEILIDQEEC